MAFADSMTDAGKRIHAEVMAGGEFIPVKITIGDGYLPAGTTLKNIKDVVSPIKDMDVISYKPTPDGNTIFTCFYSNIDIVFEYYWRELALYAKVKRKDGTYTDTVLYAYGNAGDKAEHMDAYSTSTVVELFYDFVTYVGSDAKVVLELKSEVWASKEDLEALRRELEEKGSTSITVIPLGENIPVEQRKEGHFYLEVTGRTALRISPNIRIKTN